MNRRRVARVLLIVALAFAAGALTGMVHAGKASKGRYLQLLGSADQLWKEYKKADTAYFERGRTDLAEHVSRLAALQGKLADLHSQWMATEVPDELSVLDMKVGLALELQMAGIGSELVGVMDDDQGYLDLSASLDTAYENVVNDL